MKTEYCINYDKIMSYNYNNEDLITESLINAYRGYLFNQEPDLVFITKLDIALYTYLYNKKLYNIVQDYFHDQSEYENEIALELIRLYDNFQEESFKEVETSRWI